MSEREEEEGWGWRGGEIDVEGRRATSGRERNEVESKMSSKKTRERIIVRKIR